MTGFILRRLLEIVPVLLAVVTITFFLVRLAPGGPFDSEKRLEPKAQAPSVATAGSQTIFIRLELSALPLLWQLFLRMISDISKAIRGQI